MQLIFGKMREKTKVKRENKNYSITLTGEIDLVRLICNHKSKKSLSRVIFCI